MPELDGSFAETAWEGVKWEKGHHMVGQSAYNEEDYYIRKKQDHIMGG